MENWTEAVGIFKDFNPESTKAWIAAGLTKATAEEWLKIGYNWKDANRIAWLRDQKKITPTIWKELDDNKIDELTVQYNQYFKDNNLFPCDRCWKVVDKDLMLFNNSENNLDFSDKSGNITYLCSENCRLVWNEHKELFEWKKFDKDLTLFAFRLWKKLNFNLADYQKYCQLGPKEEKFYPFYTLGWKEIFTWVACKDLIEKLGLTKYVEYNWPLVAYWKQNQTLPNNQAELQRLLEIGIPAQWYLDWMYPIDDVYPFAGENQGKRRDEINELGSSKSHLTGTLDLSDFINLEKLYCQNNQLTQLILPDPNGLVEINFSNNYLADFNYASLNPATLTELRLRNNKFETTDLSIFSRLTNLTDLEIGDDDDWIKYQPGNQFTGSLSSLQVLTKLEYFKIINTNFKPELEYLPLSLDNIICDGQILEELVLYGNSLAQWQAYHPHLMMKAKKEIVSLDDDNLVVKKAIIISKFLQTEIRKEAGTSNYQQQFNYSNFLLRDFHPFSWERNISPENRFSEKINKSLKTKVSGEINKFPESLLSGEKTNQLETSKPLPLRLYNLKNNLVQRSKELPNDVNYLALSYCWGTEWEKTPRNYGQNYQTDLTKLGRKALNKTIATWQLLRTKKSWKNKLLRKESSAFPDYIWIDNFCINQTDISEKNQEVANQRNYYSNATVTLIAVDAEIGEVDKRNELSFIRHIFTKVTSSPWFHRSWTFQEGLLSKQTIFMFDDCLVDGRRLALAWGGTQGTYSSNPSIFITPFGWSYGNNSNQSVNLNIGEAFIAVTHREQTVPVDGIYSILGLLPYGHLVKVNYKDNNEYSLVELKKTLLELIEQAYLHNPMEIITYLGARNPNNWWLPIINEDGSVQVNYALSEDDESDRYFFSKIKLINKRGVQMTGHLTTFSNHHQKIMEIDKHDRENNIEWNSTIQFILLKKTELIFIRHVEEKDIYYPEEKKPAEFFIDMVNREVFIF